MSELLPIVKPEEPTKQRFIRLITEKILGNFNLAERLIFGAILIVLGFFLGVYGDDFIKIVFSLLSTIVLALWIVTIVEFFF